ncbi:helix-turn-helix domain-containing protein [Pseudidiomarina aestuarii]|nr:helix-turn-helix transcriptional regulator [Pseudidiomarina aestuarii]
MTLGELLKEKRIELDRSQAELAEQMGIEQSYLSKLESDRSLPSTEILNAWLGALDITLEFVIAQFDPSYVQGRLRQIPSVDAYLREQTSSHHRHRRSWLLTCSLLVALSVPLFYLGYTKLLFPEQAYQYISPGILLPGDNPNLFKNWREMHYMHDEVIEMQKEMAKRENPDTLILPENRGIQFTIPAKEANNPDFQRTYYRSGNVEQIRPINGILQALGLFLFVGGIISIAIERRFFAK